MSKKYYILAKDRGYIGNQLIFWGPNNSGYTANLNRAGVYTQEQIDANPKYYNNGKETKAVPVDIVDSLSYPSVDANCAITMYEDTKI